MRRRNKIICKLQTLRASAVVMGAEPFKKTQDFFFKKKPILNIKRTEELRTVVKNIWWNDQIIEKKATLLIHLAPWKHINQKNATINHRNGFHDSWTENKRTKTKKSSLLLWTLNNDAPHATSIPLPKLAHTSAHRPKGIGCSCMPKQLSQATASLSERPSAKERTFFRQ